MIPQIKEQWPHNHQVGGLVTPATVDKRWGNEKIYVNGDPVYNTDKTSTYCMKMITIHPGQYTSSHLHVNKHETLLVISGVLRIVHKDELGDDIHTILSVGEGFVVPPGLIHRLENIGDTNLVIIEASTPDDPADSIRVSL